MNILYIVPYTPNLIRVRPYNLIRGLTDQGHQVTVMTLSSNEASVVTELKKSCYRVYAFNLPRWRSIMNAIIGIPGHMPLQASFCWHPWLADSSLEIIQPRSSTLPFDVIHIEHLRGARYGINLLEHIHAKKIKIPVIWDSVDCITYLFEQAATLSGKKLNRWIARFELGRTRKFEGYLVNLFDRVLITSEIDKTALVSLGSSNGKRPDVTVLPNGVDLTYFHPDKMITREKATLVVSGKMSYHANVTMVQFLVDKIMPIIRSRKPGVELWIVGKDPPREIRDLAEDPAITVTGTVDDIRPYLQSATIAVAPIAYGAGSQNKILEAMACATPVVTTPKGISSLAVQPGRDLLVAKEPVDIAEKILSLLDRPDQQRNIGESGRRYVEQNHNWEDISVQLAGIYAEALERKCSNESGKP